MHDLGRCLVRVLEREEVPIAALLLLDMQVMETQRAWSWSLTISAQEVAEHVLARITADVDQLVLTNREAIGLGATVAFLGT